MDAVVPFNAVFLDNMRQLWRRDPRLAQRIDDLPPDASAIVQPSKAGPATARVQSADGRALWLHSRFDPVREAADFIEKLDSGEALAFVLAGFGLGYYAKALFDEFSDEIVVIVTEPDLVTIKTALEQTNLSSELATGRLLFVTELDKAELHDRLNRHATMLMLGTCFVSPPVSRDLNADYHARCRDAVAEFAAFARMSLVTLVKNSGITCRNIANNLAVYASTPPPDVLRQQFAGCPAILVAAGPSLAKNIDQLAAWRDRAVIIAAQTTLRPLLARGIRPHFVTSLDYSDLSRHFFEGVELPDDLVLVAEPKASWHVVDAFRGKGGPNARRVILLANEFAKMCIGGNLAPRSHIEAGSTVMHLAFYLAEWLGCDPIIFIGQDLGFTNHTYYAPGVAMHRAWAPELGRFMTVEMKEWERIARHRKILRKAIDIHGREIYTDDQMYTYLQQFERDFARATAKIIDATEGGVRKAGTSIMTLDEACRVHCREPMAPERFGYLQRSWHDAARASAAQSVLAARRRDLDAFRALCEETRDVLSELQTLLHDPLAFDRRIARVDELRAKVRSHDVIFQMVGAVSQLGELQKFNADRRIRKDRATGTARAKRQLQRDEQFMLALLDGCRELANTLDEALGRFACQMEVSA